MNHDIERIVLLDPVTLKPIGEAPKLASHHENTPLHLAFSCWVFNDKGELLLTKRSANKKVWPGVWTNSFCGHPAPGESHEDAIMRRAQFELGIHRLTDLRVVLPDYNYITTPYNGIIENEFCPVYFAGIISFEGTAINPDEVQDWKFVTISELRKSIAEFPDGYSFWLKDQLSRLEF